MELLKKLIRRIPLYIFLYAFFDTIIGNMMLSMFIFALTDKKNMNMKPGKIPFAVSLVVLAINVSFGSNCGAVLNPARDFAPRYSL